MKNPFYFFVISAFIITSLAFTSSQELSKEHRDWLEAVSPIMTKTEREIFQKLKTAEERNRFIEIFWKQRDPLPDTSENEFIQEYMKRTQFANFNFGRETSKMGSRTERGYFYLLLGPPLERQIYTTHSDLNPLELWYYKGEQEYGLPPFFYLIFYQPQGMGEFRLYSPGVEGPERLVSPVMHGRGLTRNAAYQIIKRTSGELAGASLSYLPAESTFETTSFSSGTIVSSIYALPEKKFSDTYARNFLSYKDFVETEYSHNFVESNANVIVLKNAGQFFLHWSLEPKKVNFSFYNEKYYSIFQLILRIEDEKGNLVMEKEEEIPLLITPDDYKKHERRPFAIQDIIPIISGNYSLFFLLKNKTAKDFTSFQKEISVPCEGSEPSLSSMLLYHGRTELGGKQKNSLRAFFFAGTHYIINTQNNFLPQEEIGIFCQLYNLKEKASRSVLIEISSVNGEATVHSVKKPLIEVLADDSVSIDTGLLSLSSFKPGYYQAKISIVDSDGKALLSRKENFIIISQVHSVIPWIFAKFHNPFPNPEHLFLLASQYFMTGKYENSRDYLEQAVRIKDEPRSRLLLARTLYALQKFRESLAIVFPFYEKSQDREAAKIIAVNYAGLKDWASALVYLEKLMEQATEVGVLNLAAECYLNLNEPEKALPLLKKSLELNPDQDHIKELQEKAKKQPEGESHVSIGYN